MTNIQTAYIVGLKLISTRERDKGKVTTRSFIYSFPTSDVAVAKKLAKQIWEAKGFYDQARAKLSYIKETGVTA